MAKLVLSSSDGIRLGWCFMCPACKHMHKFCTADAHTEGWPIWTLTGGVDNPTVRASLLYRWGTYVDPDWRCAGDTPEEIESLTKEFSGRCHSFITNGNIEFCGDCTHELSGKTVPIPEFPAEKEQWYTK